MIAAVTGGTGFVGRALVARLARAQEFSEVRVLTRRNLPSQRQGVRYVRGDLAEPSIALDALLTDVSVVFHCAGEVREPNRMRVLHVDGTRRLVEAAANRVPLWVQLSSVGVYGQRQRAGVIDESATEAPQGDYEATKAHSDRLVARAAAASSFRYVVLRPSIVFGPGMPNRSLHQLGAMISKGRFLHVGPSDAIANYVYVDDVAEALELCAVSPTAEGVFNLSDDRLFPEFVRSFADALNVAPPARRVPEWPLRVLAVTLGRIPGFPLTVSRLDVLTRRVHYPSTRIQTRLGFRFRVSIEEGLRRYVRASGSTV